MSRSSVSTTRSIAVGLLLALVSSGALVMFSYVAGSAVDPRTSRVEASRPATRVAPVVLGSQVADTDPGRHRSRPEAPRPDGTTDEPEPLVLGIRIQSPDPEPQTRRSGDRKDHRDGNDGNRTTGPGDTKPTEPPLARKVPSGSCDCEDKKKKKKHTPNGNAYGYHRNRSGERSPGAPDESNGHGSSTPPGHSQGRGKSTSAGHSNGGSPSGGKGHAHGHDKSRGKP